MAVGVSFTANTVLSTEQGVGYVRTQHIDDGGFLYPYLHPHFRAGLGGSPECRQGNEAGDSRIEIPGGYVVRVEMLIGWNGPSSWRLLYAQSRGDRRSGEHGAATEHASPNFSAASPDQSHDKHDVAEMFFKT